MLSRKKRDLTGRVFGRLTVLGPAPKRKTPHAMWVCECRCGELYVARGTLLVNGVTTRCLKCAAAAAVETRAQPDSAPDVDFELSVYRLAATGKVKEIMDVAHERIRRAGDPPG